MGRARKKRRESATEEGGNKRRKTKTACTTKETRIYGGGRDGEERGHRGQRERRET